MQMKKEDKIDSIRFWDDHAQLWEEKAYDKRKTYLRFPTSQKRQEITIQNIEKLALNKKVSIIDIGCANGELVRTLLRKEFTNAKGIDNSKNMINTAKKELIKELPHLDPDNIFSVSDADNFNVEKPVDFITAMGLIEYLIDIDGFFNKLYNILKPGGYVFIESRNKLFNLFSANEFTQESKIKELVKELKDIEKFSPIRDENEIEEIIRKTFISIGKSLENVEEKKEEKETTKFKKYPFKLPQYTPNEIEAFCKKSGLRLKNIIYYHPHPFIPKFENKIPKTFNRIALLMQLLGYTPLGATICSSFVSVIEKPN